MQPDGITLSIDQYALTMVQGYLAAGLQETAVFEFFVRGPVPHRNFLVAAGVEQVVTDLERLRWNSPELNWVLQDTRLETGLLAWLNGFRFAGEVHAMPEGTLFFPDEPVLRVTAPLPQAQLIESFVINRLHFQTLIASKAIRCVLAAGGKQLVDFGLRRAHGLEAGLYAARSSYLAGFDGTSNVLAGQRYGIPLYGSMAHSYVEAHDSEEDAFETFARANPENAVIVLDTYDTEEAARRVVELAPRLGESGLQVLGVRLDSGDLAVHARAVRSILDQGGLSTVKILASGNLDEWALAELASRNAPIDGYGVGTSLTTSSDLPCLNCAYKLQSYDGVARRKTSEGKATWPGVKQVYREFDAKGGILRDTIALDDENPPQGQPLLRQMMAHGERVRDPASLDQARACVAERVGGLPESLRTLSEADAYPVRVTKGLTRLAAELDARYSRERAPHAANGKQSIPVKDERGAGNSRKEVWT